MEISVSIHNSEDDDQTNTPLNKSTKNDEQDTWHWYSSFFLFGIFLSIILMFVFQYQKNAKAIIKMIPIGTICTFAFGISLEDKSILKTIYEIINLS